MNFISELKRRNVIRMAGLYLVGAWLIVQVAATLLPVFEARLGDENAGWFAGDWFYSGAGHFLGV